MNVKLVEEAFLLKMFIFPPQVKSQFIDKYKHVATEVKLFFAQKCFTSFLTLKKQLILTTVL